MFAWYVGGRGFTSRLANIDECKMVLAVSVLRINRLDQGSVVGLHVVDCKIWECKWGAMSKCLLYGIPV